MTAAPAEAQAVNITYGYRSSLRLLPHAERYIPLNTTRLYCVCLQIPCIPQRVPLTLFATDSGNPTFHCSRTKTVLNVIQPPVLDLVQDPASVRANVWAIAAERAPLGSRLRVRAYACRRASKRPLGALSVAASSYLLESARSRETMHSPTLPHSITTSQTNQIDEKLPGNLVESSKHNPGKCTVPPTVTWLRPHSRPQNTARRRPRRSDHTRPPCPVRRLPARPPASAAALQLAESGVKNRPSAPPDGEGSLSDRSHGKPSQMALCH